MLTDNLKHMSLSRWELLTAMQALSIYILIRVDEGETEYNDFDALLIAAVTVSLTPALFFILYLTAEGRLSLSNSPTARLPPSLRCEMTLRT